MKNIFNYVLTVFFFFTANLLAVDKTIDRRTMTDVTGSTYYVIFANRAGLPGHAFITWIGVDKRSNLCIYKAYGFYPESNSVTKGIFGNVTGEIRNDVASNSPKLVQNRLKVKVNYSVWLSSQNLINKWSTSKYNLYTSNCISFTIDVAKWINISAPSKGVITLPEVYMLKVINAN